MSATAPEAKLTKKEKKALAFRANKGKGKGKGKKEQDQEDVPEQDLLDEEPAAKEESAVKAGKKRKRDTPAEDDEQKGEDAAEGEEEQPKKKKRQRGGKSAGKGKVSATNPDGSKRLLLFVGNLSFKTTQEEVAAHFAPCGETPQVRLLTPKAPAAGVAPTAKSKGCAFIEFTTPQALQSALRLHESTLQNRKINVELTAGGGGNSDARRKKIEESRQRLGGEREKSREKKAKKEAAAGATKAASAKESVESKAEGGEKEPLKTRVTTVNGKKVRDRRIPKGNTPGQQQERARKLDVIAKKSSSGANAIRLSTREWGTQ
ncbi:hypothetical protein T439DRAFT_349864 [Meredithblackwellia eburnea MCA 4105]